jgi:tetratricopeptide (TPR) repeat protein
LKQLGELEAARSAYEETLRRFPSNVLTRNGLTTTLAASGLLTEAAAMSRETVRRFPDEVEAHTHAASILALLGDLDGARAGYEAVLARAPHDEHARTGLGLVLFRSDSFAQAEKLLVAPSAPTTARDWFRTLALGLLALRRGDFDKAESVLTLGARRCPFIRHRQRFEVAAALAAIQRSDPLRVARTLLGLPPTSDVLAMDARRFVAARAFFEAGRRSEGRALLAPPSRFRLPCVTTIESGIRGYYGRSGSDSSILIREEERLWDAEIELLTL